MWGWIAKIAGKMFASTSAGSRVSAFEVADGWQKLYEELKTEFKEFKAETKAEIVMTKVELKYLSKKLEKCEEECMSKEYRIRVLEAHVSNLEKKE